MADRRLPFSDVEIVSRIRDGDERMFEALFRAYFELLHRVANAITRAPDVAEDVVCEVMETLYRRRSELTIATTLEAYLVRAVRNRALNVVRGQRREIARYTRLVNEGDDVALAGEMPASDAEMVEAEDTAERDDAFHSALDELAPAVRTLVTLRWERGMSVPEIAEILGVSEPAVRMKMSRLVRYLRERLGGSA